MGWASQFGSLDVAPVVLYLASILWVIGYDTIYALQDIEDDALIGVKSTARLFGRRARAIVALFYAGAWLLWVASGVMAGAGLAFAAASLVPGAVLAWQLTTLDRASPENSLRRFKANHWAGLALTLALLIEYWT
jgi:4-hydroxybenzoate polyprenyltransferase